MMLVVAPKFEHVVFESRNELHGTVRVSGVMRRADVDDCFTAIKSTFYN